MAGWSEVLRVLSEERLLWVEPMKVSKQARSKRLMKLAAQLFAQVFEQVMATIGAEAAHGEVPRKWQQVERTFPAVWIADGSTLEELRKKLKALQEQSTVLGGKMMMVVAAFTHQPVTTWSDSERCGVCFAVSCRTAYPESAFRDWSYSTDSAQLFPMKSVVLQAILRIETDTMG